MAGRVGSKRKLPGFILFLCLMTCGVIGLWSQSAGSGTNLCFPRFVASQNADNGIAIFNPGSSDATVSLALTGPSGQTMGNPVNLVVPAFGQVTSMPAQLFGVSGNVDASLQVNSASDGLVPFFETFDPQSTMMDGAGVPTPAVDLIFPVMTGNDEINLVNPNNRDTLADLRLWRMDGTMLGQATARIVSHGKMRGSVTGIFPSVRDFSAASHLTVRSTSASLFLEPQTISGVGIFPGIPPLSAALFDVAALNAVPVTEISNIIAIPHFRVGPQHFSTVSIANIEPASADVSVTAIRNDGFNLGTRKLILPGHGGFRQPFETLFPAVGDGDTSGWMLFQGSGRISASVIFGHRTAGAISALHGQGLPQTRFVFPHAVQGSGLFTEISLANPGPNPSFVEMFVIDPSGTTIAGTQFTLPAGTGISKRLDRHMPEVQSLSGGTVFVRASQPLFGTASIWSDSGTTAANITPQAVPAGFSPAPLRIFAVSGTVLLNSLPAKDFPVILSGDATNMTKTQDDGTYVFSGLPAGNYSVRVDQFGFQFDPPQVDFQLSPISKRQDFQGFTPENGIVVVPASIPAGSPDVTALVYGNNFNSTSATFVGPVSLETHLVNPTLLRVVLPSFLFKSATQFELHVVTDGSRISGPYQVVVFLAHPVLSSVKPSRDIVEGSPDAAVTFGGSGFLDGATVKINGKSDGISVSYVSDKEIVAVVPASFFAQGGVFPVTVVNPYPVDSESNVQLLSVFFPKPAIESISPDTVTERLEDSSGPVRLDVYGYGFRRGAVVLLEDTPLPTDACSDTPACASEHLIATVDPSFLRQSGFKRVEVQNPNPSLGVSQVMFLRVESLQPTITSVFPGSATVLPTPPEYSLPVLVYGTNFEPGAQVQVTHIETSVTGATVISSTQLFFTITVSYPDALGQWMARVINPQPGGGMSEPAFFLITQGSFVANPFLTSLTPDVVSAGGPSFTLVVNGTNFQPGSQINFFSAPLVTTFVSSNQLTAEVPASLITTPGKRPITVTNPGNGGTSNRLYIEVQ